MSCRTTVTIALLSLAVACSGEAPVPAAPTWVDDVLPILRGNCLNCHGVTASVMKLRTKRWDVCDLDAFAAVGPFADDPKAEFVSARNRLPDVFRNYLLPSLGQTRPNMPPLPDPILTDRQTQTLAAWMENPVCGKRANNAKPTVSWLTKPTRFLVEDGDGDQVLGTISCGTAAPETIPFAGAHELPAGARLPCSLQLSDGQDAVKLELEE
jgi:hypothetical protein